MSRLVTGMDIQQESTNHHDEPNPISDLPAQIGYLVLAFCHADFRQDVDGEDDYAGRARCFTTDDRNI